MSQTTLQSGPTRLSPLERLLWRTLAVLAIGASIAMVLTFDYGRDQGIYAVVAREMLAGGAPYSAAFDFKPPGIFAVYALSRSLFGAGMGGIRVLEAVSMLINVWALLELSRRHFGGRGVGLCAAVIALQIHAQLDFWHTAQPETFGGTLTLLGLLAYSHARTAKIVRARKLLVCCGALFGLAGLMKPPLAGVGALIGVVYGLSEVVAARREDRSVQYRAVLARPLWVALGGILPFVLTATYFVYKGALADLVEVLFVFTPHYTKISWENASVLSMSYYGVSEWLTTYSSALLLGFVCLAVTGGRGSDRGFVWLLLGAIGVHIAGIVMQAKFFQYHWGATFPLSALLAAAGLVRVYELARARSQWLALASGAAMLLVASAKMPVPSFGESFVARSRLRLELLAGKPTTETENWDALASVADVSSAQNRAVARYLAEHTAAHEPVFVWGFECVIYDLADRPLASRYIYNVPQRATWSAEPMRAKLMAELAQKPPAAIVVEHGDVFSFVTGNNLDSARSLQGFPALQTLLDERYQLAQDIGDFEIYLKRP